MSFFYYFFENMKFLLFILFVISIISSCTVVDKVKYFSAGDKEIFTTVLNDSLEISYDEDGNFISATISVSEKVKIDLPGAKVIASSRALVKAEKLLSNFIENIDKKIFLSKVTQTLVIVQNTNSKEIPIKLISDIKTRKKNILNSLYVERQIYYRENRILSIIARASTKFDKATRKLKKIFNRDHEKNLINLNFPL